MDGTQERIDRLKVRFITLWVMKELISGHRSFYVLEPLHVVNGVISYFKASWHVTVMANGNGFVLFFRSKL